MEAILENLRNLRQKSGSGEEDTIKLEDVEVCCTLGISPFHVLTALNMHKELKMILENDDNVLKRRNINEKSKMEGDTALHIAALSDSTDMIEVLIEAGADFTIKNDSGQTPFMLAVAKGKGKFVNELWKYKSKFDVNTTDTCGNSALHAAAERKWSSCINHLLGSGAKVDVVNNDGQTPLNIAASKGDLKSVKILVEHGASILNEDKSRVTRASAILLAIAQSQKEIALFLLSKLDSEGIDIIVASLAENVRINIKHDKTCETMMHILVHMFIACVQSENARESLLKHKVVSTWISVLKRFSASESSSCEKAFCCICQLMLDVDKPELIAQEFVQEFTDCGGPDVTVDLLQAFAESRRGSMVIGAFCMLLPLCKVAWGRKWLRRNYHKIVECYQFFDSATELLHFPDHSLQKVKTIWQEFKETFDEIQATESKKHEAELLAEEEMEKAKREKKNERKKKKEQKKAHNEKTKEMSFSPNTRLEEAGENRIEGTAVYKTPEKDVECTKSEAKQDFFEKVLSKKELKLSKKKTDVVEVLNHKTKNPSPEPDEIFLNFRPNRGKPSGFKCKETKPKPSDLPWRDAKKSAELNKSPGKEFPKLCKEKFANMLQKVEEENKKTHVEIKQHKTGKDMFKFNDNNNIKKYLSPNKRQNNGRNNLSPAKPHNYGINDENTVAQTVCSENNEIDKKDVSSLTERILKVKQVKKDTFTEEKNFNDIFGSRRQLFEKRESSGMNSEARICENEDEKCETKVTENSPTSIPTKKDVIAEPNNKCTHLLEMMMNDVRAYCEDLKASSKDNHEKDLEDPGKIQNTDLSNPEQTKSSELIGSSEIENNLRRIWDISPAKQEVEAVMLPPFVIPVEPVSPVSKANKKRSRATFIAPREPFKMSPDDLVTLDVARKNEENTQMSSLEIFKMNTLKDVGEIHEVVTSEKIETRGEETDFFSKNLPVTALGNKGFEFLSESRLKSSGSIISDISEPQWNTTSHKDMAIDVTEIQFGYFSSSTSTFSSEAKEDSKCGSEETNNADNCVSTTQSVEKSNVNLSDFVLPPLEHSIDLNSKPRPHSDSKVPFKSSNLEYEPLKPQFSRTESPKLSDRIWLPPNRFQNRFGAVGEPCPVSYFNHEFRRKGFCSDSEKKDVVDHSRLQLGDGDRLLDDDEPREVFGSRSDWKEPSHFGYGWLDGLSQAVSAQKDLVNTDNMDTVLQRYPLFNQGMDYETYKRRKLEEQWNNNQMFPQYDMWSCGEPVHVDLEKASSLLPQNLLDSPGENSDVVNHEHHLHEADIQNNWSIQDQRQQQRILKDKNWLPVQQLSGFQTGDIGFPQPGIPVAGNPQTAQVPHGKLQPFNAEPSQTGQGDPHFYHNVYMKVLANVNYSNNRANTEIPRSLTVPFLSSASAMVDAGKVDPLQVRMTPEYLSESSDKSSLTSTTINTINSFKSANELVCSRSDISVSHERLGESFVIGKGKFGSTIYEGWTGDGRLVAIRRMKLEEFDARERQLATFIRTKLSHKNICDILEVKKGDQYGFVVMERFKENLKHFITRTRAQGYHPLQHLISMCRGLVHGLAFLHNQNIFHGRLCPENILLGPNDAVKLSDYGLPVATKPVYQRTEFHDDPKSIWLCSESLECGETMTLRDHIFKADVQVSAMLIYYTLTLGDHPFGRCPEEVLENLSQGPSCMRQLGEEFDDILPKMLTVRPDQRLCMEQVKLHPFLWTDSEKFRFLVTVGHHLYRSKESKNEVSATLERCINDLSPTSGKQSWVSFTQTSLVQEITGLLPWIAFRYNVGGLLSFMEAADTYQHLLSASSQKLLGGHPEVYFLTRFPALPIRVHQLVRVLERQLPVFLYPTIDC